MIRFLAPCLLAALAVGTPAAAVHRGGPVPLYFYIGPNATINQPIDYLTWCGDCISVNYQNGNPWVVNPLTGWPFTNMPACDWDTDDGYQWVAASYSYLPAGSSVTVTECRYAGPSASLPTDVYLISSSPDLQVTETWAWDGGSITTVAPSPTYDKRSHGWAYFDCVMSPQDGTMTKVEIPGSNSGYAVPQRIMVTVANQAAKKVSVGGWIESGWANGWERGCQSWRTA